MYAENALKIGHFCRLDCAFKYCLRYMYIVWAILCDLSSMLKNSVWNIESEFNSKHRFTSKNGITKHVWYLTPMPLTTHDGIHKYM